MLFLSKKNIPILPKRIMHEKYYWLKVRETFTSSSLKNHFRPIKTTDSKDQLQTHLILSSSGNLNCPQFPKWVSHTINKSLTVTQWINHCDNVPKPKPRSLCQNWRKSSELRMCTALSKDQSLVSNTHIRQLTTCNFSSKGILAPSFGLHGDCAYMHIPTLRHTCIHII